MPADARARIVGYGAFQVSAKDYASLLRRANGACAYCSIPLTAKTLHWDHIVPVSRGGAHSVGNLAPSCAPCNQQKSAKLLVEWRLSSMTILTA